MQSPFSITLFATTGDPQGIRHVDKSNWSGFGVVFSRDHVSILKNQAGFDQASVYLLVGNVAEETIYIGEADPVGERLKSHVANKKDWNWGVYFFDKNHKIGKTEVKFLESELVAKAKANRRVILLNKNHPTPPTMSPVAKATAQAFLDDMLLILPMLGINAFIPAKSGDRPEESIQPIVSDKEQFDTIVVPAREEGFQEEFIKQKRWYSIRINAKHIQKIKYIAAYQVAPITAITHIAEIKNIVPYETTGKYLINFKDHPITIDPVRRKENSTISMQSPRYALKEKILAAKDLDEIWSKYK